MRKSSVLLAMFALMLAAPAYAQRSTGSLRGTVKDATQAVLPGATVTATNEDTGLVRTTVTNAAGVYSVPELPVGRYNVSAELQGFKTATRTGILLRVADDLAIDFELPTGQVTETVNVEARSAPVKTIGGDVSGLVTGEMVRELPLNGRNFLQLATLMPGVSAPDMLNVKDKGLLGGSDLSVSGSDVTANMWTVDGANNNDVGSNRTILVYPSLEAIEEFKILRNSYGPEFGGAGGAQINIVTRGGTNKFSGTTFYSGRTDKLNATNYFLEKANQPKEPLKRNDFGASLGGPIVKNKVQFFGSVEWNLEKRGTARAAFVPTQAERNGDFSGASIPGCTGAMPIDPLTGAAFPGNKIPANRISQAGQNYLNLYALPNVTPAAGSCNNWVTSVTTPINWGQYHGRVDWTASGSTRLMVRYTHDTWKNNSPSLQSNLWGDDKFPAVDSNWDQPGTSLVASLSQTFGQHATNNLQFSYSANKITVTRGGTNPGLNATLVSEMPSIFPLSGKEYGADVGHPVFWGGGGYDALWNEAPFHNNQDLFVLKDDYTRVFGKHLFKVGALASMNRKNEDTSGNGSTENWNFWGPSGLNGWGSQTGNILANFLLKDMAWGFSETSTSHPAAQRWHDVELYAADSWQVTPRVTFDYGVRYSLFYDPYVADDRLSSFQPSLFNAALGNDPCNGLILPPGTNWCQQDGFKGGTAGPNRSLQNQDLHNIAPRLGLAYDVFGNGKTAIRAGLGQFYLRERLSPGLNIAGNPPFTGLISGTRFLDSNQPCDGCFGAVGGGAPSAGRAIDQKTPYSWQWNTTIQHEIWRNTTLEVGYVGNYGYDLLRNHDANQILPGDIDHNGIPDRLQYVTTTPADAALRPFGVFGDTHITFWDHTGRSTYHSLQTQFISRFGRASQFQMSYTLARSRANLSLTSSDGSLSKWLATNDLTNPGLDWGRPETGRTHIFNSSLVWLLPSLDNSSKGERAVLGDWEVATILGIASGAPLDVFTGSIPGLNGGPSGTGYTDSQRPNRTSASCDPPSGSPLEQIINPAAFTLTGFQLGTIGSARRGDCTGPGYAQVDMALYKNFTLPSGMKLQFRWDIFNLFNRANFLSGYGGTNFNDTMNPTAVTLNNADPSKATVITGATVPASFGQATRTRDPRQMQIGFKIIW
jgi:hypothetical protein